MKATPKLRAEAKRPGTCSDDEIAVFCAAVQEGDEVDKQGLEQRIRNSKALAFLHVDGTLVGVAGLKQPRVAYRDDVFKKAEVPRLATQFNLELGWAYVFPDHRGKHYSEALSIAAVAQSEGERVFATTRLDNIQMQKALERIGFERVGSPYSSKRGRYKLLLYLKSGR